MEAKNMTKRRSRTTQATRDEMAKKLKIERDKDRQMVKGVFKYYEVPGGMVGFCFKKYAEDPLEKYELYDNQVYTIPLGVAKHLNNNTWYPIHEYGKNEDNTPMQRIGQKIRRMAFQSLEFMDTDGMGENISRITTVENVITT
jgi:hypothetical protein